MRHVGLVSPPERAEMTPGLALAIAGLASAFLLLRLLGINWDSGAALNPDARHLFNIISAGMPLVEQALADGLSWRGLILDGEASPLNPRSRDIFYVYGDFPLIAQNLTVYALGMRDYTDIIVVARAWSAVLYAITIVAVCLAAWVARLSAPMILVAGVAFATAPTAFQIGGFGAVDIWLVAAWALAGLGMLTLVQAKAPSGHVAFWTGLAMGAAISSKVTGAGLALPALVVLWLLWQKEPVNALRIGLIALFATLASVRVLSPFSFDGLFSLAPSFTDDLAELVAISASDNFPPRWQWQIPRAPAEALRDVLLFGVGPVMGLAALSGIALAPRDRSVWVLSALAAPLLVYFLVSETHALRYLAPSIAPLAVLAAFAFRRAPVAAVAVALAAMLVWGSGIVRLHLSENSRVAATRWLLAQPGPQRIAIESFWDDPLPLYVPGLPRRADIEVDSLALELPAGSDKVERIVALVSTADFVVSSSGRFSEVQPHLPERFPVSAAWFAGLEDGSLCLEPVWQARPGYPLAFFRFDDTAVQEPWTVYDHAPVTLYARTACFDTNALRAALSSALRSD